MANLCGELEDSFLGCDENSGGIEKIWLFDMADIAEIVEDSDMMVIKKLELPAAPKVFELVRQTASYTDELTTEVTNASIQWTQTLNIQKNVRNSRHSKIFRLFTKGLRYLGILVLDNNGEYSLIQNAQLSTVTDGSGTVGTDGSKYLASFIATNTSSMMFLNNKDEVATFIATGIYEDVVIS